MKMGIAQWNLSSTISEGVRHFIAGSVPEVIITDAAYNVPVWVDPLHPDGWVDELRRALGATWAKP